MRGTSGLSLVVALLGAGAWAQTHPADPQPIYRVTVVSRTLAAINYQHMSGPTSIDLNGTVLLPQARGTAVVESKRGRTTIDAKVDRMDAPTRFGTQYLTYVLWAITPEGRPKNLGEVLVDGSNKSHINVTTDLQAFGLMITAEPYYAVTQPSDAVVLENVVRPDTMGTREVVNARYDLMPRGGYTMNVQSTPVQMPEGRKIPYDQYEAVLELYQAENAVQIARSMGAGRFAPEPYNKAVALLDQARQMQRGPQDPNMVVTLARNAAQTAEDARVIAVKRQQEEQLLEAQRSHDEARIQAATAAVNAEEARAQAAQQQAQAEQAAAQAARQQAQAEEAAAEQERQQAEQASRERVEQQAPREQVEQDSSEPPPPVVGEPIPRAKYELSGDQRKTRAELLAQLNALFVTRDTPRGLVVTVTDPYFESESSDLLRPAATERLMRLTALLRTHPDLVARVEGHVDDRQRGDLCQHRTDMVRTILVRYGAAPNSVLAQSFGSSRPLQTNATPAGREQNRRVEIIISGPSIGDMPLWDRTYSLKR
ncbi:MAG TPA: OmpA family protein [Bryobacteraceae bacterium]|nr:OmpA family protein [Bryobacteraceae bacterium]